MESEEQEQESVEGSSVKERGYAQLIKKTLSARIRQHIIQRKQRWPSESSYCM